jgi:PAS domain S-box-containing protein
MAFKWANSINVVGFVVLVWFLVAYAESWPHRRWLPVSITAIFLSAAVANMVMPYGFLYTEITGLTTLTLPWGEQISLAEGTTASWRIFTDLAFVGLIVLALDLSIRLWRKENRLRAALLGGALTSHLVLTLVIGFLVDLGIISIPYLQIYGFLAVVLAMNYDLAGEIVRSATLAEEVRANERRWQSLLENVHLLVAGADREGYVDYINPFFSEVTGFSEAEAVGKPFTDFLPPEIREERKRAHLDALDGRVQSHSESKLVTKAGEVRTILWSQVLLRNPEGAVTGTLGIGADITEQRKAEAARDEALAEVERALREVETLKNRLEEEVVYLRDEIAHIGRFDEIVGQSDALKYVLHRVEQVAPLDTTVFIEGETGVGKELFARAIHRLSARKNRALVTVNCGALPATLIEAELFGHEKGAFTGATRTRRGRFEVADGGTLFLDEVGELPLELQGKLLRVLQDGELERVGGETTIRVDVRVIAATNRRLREEIEQGGFREDLFYRLHVYPITVPPLRQRKGDLSLLVNAFVQKFARDQGKRIDEIPRPLMEELERYDWPGNVRELENVIERAVITTRDNTLRLAAKLPHQNKANAEIYKGSLDDVDRNYIRRILDHAGWRIEGKAGAAELLKIHPNTLRFRMRKLGIERPRR